MNTSANQEGQAWIDYHCAQIYDLYHAQEYSRCLAIIEESLLVWSDHPYLLRMKALSLIGLNRTAEAIQALRYTKKFTHFDRTITETLAIELMFQGYYHASLQEMGQYFLMTAGQAGYPMIWISFCQVMTGITKPVMEYCDRLEEAFIDDPDSEGILASLSALRSLCYSASGKGDKAWELMEQIAEKCPSELLVAYAAGAAAKAIGNYPLAEFWLKKAIEIEPRNMQARFDLNEILTIIGRDDEADKIRRTITGFFGLPITDPDPVIRAEELILAKKFVEALSYLTSFEKKTEDPGFHIALIKALFFTGDYEGAITAAEYVPDENGFWMALYLKAAAFYAVGKIQEAYKALVTAAMRDRTYFIRTLQDMESNGFFSQVTDQKPEAMVLEVLIRDGPASAATLLETLLSWRLDIPEYADMLAILSLFTNNHIDALKFSDRPFNAEEPESRLVRVFVLRNSGCMKEAEELARMILDKQPTSLTALYHYVRTLIEQDKYRDAYKQILSFPADTGTDPWIMELLIRCFIRSGDYNDAARVAFRVLVLFQNRPLDYALIGRAFILDSQYSLAVYALLEGLRICGVNADTVYYYVQALLQTGNPSEASAIINNYLNPFPDSAKARYLRTAAAVLSGGQEQEISVPEYAQKIFLTESGVLRSYIGEYPIAARMLSEEIRDDPDDRNLRTEYAACLIELERYSEALHQFSIIHDLFGDIAVEGRNLMKGILFGLNLDVHQKELTLIAGNDTVRLASLVHEKARRLCSYDMKKMGISTCHHLISIRSDDIHVKELQADAYHMLGDLENEDRRYEESCSVYDSLLAAFPKNAKWLAEKGLVLNNLSRYQDAKEILEQALDLDSEDGKTYSALCWCLSCLGEGEKALEIGNRAVQLLPSDWGSWNNRGLARLQIDDTEGALNDFRQALRCSPGEKIAHTNLCSTLLNMEDESASEAYSEFLIRFGRCLEDMEDEENHDPFSSRNRGPRVATGYMEGYW